MILKSLRHKSLILLALASLSLSSCINDSVSECAGPESKSVVLRLALNGVGGNITRANGEPDDFYPANGKFETVNQLRVLIVRLNDAKTHGIVEANRMVRTSEAGVPINDNLEFKVIAEENKRVYLIANEAFLPVPDAVATYKTTSIFLDSFKAGDVVDLSLFTDWTVSMPGVTTGTQTVTSGIFSPTVSTNRLPLTEFFDIFVTRERAIDDIFHANMFLTRAAAKAQFFIDPKTYDNLAETGVINSRITAIEFEGISTTEYVFPNEAVYTPTKKKLLKPETTTEQLKKAYITSFKAPKPNQRVNYLIDNLNGGNGIEIKKPATNTPTQLTDVFYFPETMLNSDEKFKVRVQLDGNYWIEGELDPKNEDTVNILQIEGKSAIARNTYLPINLKFDGAAQLTMEVLPWDREDYYVDYAENIGFNDNDYLEISGTQGQNGDYLLLDKVAAQLVLNYGKVAKGSFYIPSPVGSTWDAYLITTGGSTDAIQFQIPDPNDATKTITTTHISGKTGDGNKAEFGIVATVAPGATQNSAQLMVIVTLANGVPVVANIIGNWETDEDRLTIIENQQ